MNDTIDFKGQTFKLGCNVPTFFPTKMAPITSAPGFRIWTKQEIQEFINTKPMKRRQQFAGPNWIINQGGLGSCNGAAAVGSLRRNMTLSGRNDVPLLSWEFLYAQINGGRDNGSLLIDGMDELTNGTGVCPLNLQKHPINKHWKANQYDAEDYEAAMDYRAEQCFAIDNEFELATFVLSGGSAVVAVHVGRDFANLDRHGIAGSDDGPGNHAVVVDDVEIIDGELSFDEPNSWGLDFGDDGRAYLTWKRHFRQTVGKHRFYAIVAASNPGGLSVAA